MNNNINKLGKESLITIIIVVLFLFGGCGVSIPTQYNRHKAAKGEIVWAFDEGLIASKDSIRMYVVACDTLSKAVSCVKEAKSLVELAGRNYSKSSIFVLTGLSVFIAGVTYGVITMYNDRMASGQIRTDPTPERGELIMLGGAIIGGIIENIGAKYLAEGVAQEIDAVNIYNCNFQKTPECKNDSTISSHNNNKNVK
jgi:hypothetical protein